MERNNGDVEDLRDPTEDVSPRNRFWIRDVDDVRRCVADLSDDRTNNLQRYPVGVLYNGRSEVSQQVKTEITYR